MGDLKKSSREIYDKLSKSAQDTYDRAISFLTSDYAKVLGTNAIISILSLILIGGASLAGTRGIEKLQLGIDTSMVRKSPLKDIAAAIIEEKNKKKPSAKDIKIEGTQARIKLLDLLSKLGGEHGVKTAAAGGLKGKGFNDDIKKKFKEASKKVYDAITSDEAKLLGKNALVTIILAAMGYGASKFIKGPQKGEIQKSAQDIEHDIKIRDLELKSKELKDLHDAEFAKKIQEVRDEQRKKEKAMYEMAADIQAHKSHMKTKYPVEYGAESDPEEEEEEYYEVQTTNPAIIKPTVERPTFASGLKGGKWTTQSIKDYLHKVVTSKEAKALGATALATLIIAGLGIAGTKALKRKSTWETEIDAEYIENMRKARAVKENLHEIKNNIKPIKKATAVVDILEEELERQMGQSIKPDTFEKEEEEELRHALNIPLSTLATNKAMAELDEMYKKIESDTMTKPIAKKMADNFVDNIIDKKNINPIRVDISMSGNKPYNAPEFIDYYSKEVVIPHPNKKELVSADREAVLAERAAEEKARAIYFAEWERAREESQKGVLKYDLDKMPIDQRAEYFRTHKLSPDELKSIYGMHRKEYEDIQKNLESGKGLKGKGFNNDVKKAKDKIYKIITSPEAKVMGISALSSLILATLGGLGYYASNKYKNNLKLAEDERRHAAERKFIEKQKADWGVEETTYKEGERASHFIGEGLKEDTQKGLKIASKKIANLIQYARDLGLDKAALVSLITFLLGGVGYGGFKYISKKARESEPFGYVPEDEVRQALEDFATGKHRMAERIKADTKDANLPWGGFGLMQKLKGGDLSKFGNYAKKKEEAEKNAKPIAKKITDWIYSDEAKLIGKAAIQYSILSALGILTAYAGKKAGEAAISAIPKDRTKVNDPEAIMKGLNAPTGDIEEVKKQMGKYGVDTAIRTAWKEDPTIKNEDPLSLSMPQRGRIVSPEILNLRRFALENPKNKAVQKYLKELGYTTPYSEDIMRMDPSLAALFNIKADKPTKEIVQNYTGPIGDYYINPEDRRGPTKKITYSEGYKGIKEFLKENTPTFGEIKNEKLEEELKEDDKHLKEFIDKNLPKEAGSDIDVAIKALEKVEQNRPSGIVQPKKLDKSLLAKFSGTSAPMPKKQGIEKLTNKEKNEIVEGIAAIFEGGDGLKKNKGKGFKEDLNSFSKSSIKNINKVGDAIYKVISSNEVKGVAGGVTAGLIVSILSMLMHEKRQEVLAARRAAPARPPRVRPNYPAPPPPPTRGDNEFNPFATV